jgi:hypothetical protein
MRNPLNLCVRHGTGEKLPSKMLTRHTIRALRRVGARLKHLKLSLVTKVRSTETGPFDWLQGTRSGVESPVHDPA